MDYEASQADMSNAYFGGATGVFASGLIWCLAGLVVLLVSELAGMVSLLLGGMLIFPLSILFSKLLGRSGKYAAENVLGYLALETLGVLFVGLFLAFVIAQFQLNLFFSSALLVIGARYFLFQTLYGMKVYWFLAGSLIVAGGISIAVGLRGYYAALLGGGLELLFAVWIFKICSQENRIKE